MKYSYYRVKITGKDPKAFLKRILKLPIYFLNITYFSNSVYIDIDYENYQKLKNMKTSYSFKIIRRYGVDNFLFCIKKYGIYYITLLLCLGVVFFLSHIIFDVEVIHNSKEMRDLVSSELKKYHIEKYRFVTSFKNQEKIAKEIIYKNKDAIEWMELKREGTKYTISVEKRKKQQKQQQVPKRHIVASKNGILLKIDAKTGEVVKKINDYVNKGDIVVSGFIKNKDTVKSIVSADGKIYAEVWYTVKVSLPKSYKEEKKTGRKKTILKLQFLNKDFAFFSSYKEYKDEDIKGVSSRLLPLSFKISKREELKVKRYHFQTENALNEAIKRADKKIKKDFKDNEYIISKKVLKKEENNSTIDIEVFYKVCEDITGFSEIHESMKEINDKIQKEVA